MQRFGTPEHILVQVDFLKQAALIPRSEYTIPGASYPKGTEDGYADIVSLASKSIWEIKPENDVTGAVAKAQHYVDHANSECGGKWKLGQGYKTSDGSGIVFRYPAVNPIVYLMAWEPTPGAVVYRWVINGVKQQLPLPWVHRQVLYGYAQKKYFPRQSTLPVKQPAYGPGKWTPPVLAPNFLIPELAEGDAARLKLLTALQNSIRSAYFGTILDGSAVAVGIEIGAFKAMPAIQAKQQQQQTALFGVQRDPTVELYRQTVLAFNLAGASAPLVTAAGFGGLWVLETAIALGPTAAAAIFRFATQAPQAVGRAATKVATTLGSSLQGGSLVRVAAPAGASAVVFLLPQASQASPTTPQAINGVPTLVKWLAPDEVDGVSVGQSMQIDGTDTIIVALLTPAPDPTP